MGLTTGDTTPLRLEQTLNELKNNLLTPEELVDIEIGQQKDLKRGSKEA